MDVPLLKVLFTFNAAFIIIVGLLLNTVERYLPTYLIQTFRFGKFSYQGKGSWIKPIEVPKRWFRHFYLFASAFSLGCLLCMLNVYVLAGSPPAKLVELLDILGTKQRTYSVPTICSLIAMLLLTAQSVRRFYETWFISVFSDARMNISHYLIGFIHYFGAVCAVLMEAPGFTSHKGVSPLVLRLQVSEIGLYHILAVASFAWAFHHQFKAAVILADLRKDESGKVVSEKYCIPEGDLFEIVSSPHMLMEVVMYISLMILLWGNSFFPYITVWVISNQFETALETHWWYQKKFEDYPAKRKAIIPFIL